MKKQILPAILCVTIATAALANSSTHQACAAMMGDTLPPTIICWNGIAASTDNLGQFTVHVSDFVYSVSDDSTPPALISIAIRKCGLGFPFDEFGNLVHSLTFDCSELGTQCVEVWAIDTSGNGAAVETYVIVQDNINACKPGKQKEGSGFPSILLTNGLSVSLNEQDKAAIPLKEFVRRLSDDMTPPEQLVLGIRECGTGSGMPVDGNGQPVDTLILNCFDMSTQCVEIWARDEHGNAVYTYTYVILEDNYGYCQGISANKSPMPVCRHGLTANLSPRGQVSLRVSDFLQNAYDDSTPADLVAMSMREAGAGSGFPLDSMGLPVQEMTFEKRIPNTVPIEIWVKDTSGNENYANTYLIIYDGNESISLAPLVPCAYYGCNGAPLGKLDWQVSGKSPWAGNYSRQISSTAYCSPLNGALHFFGSATVTPKPNSSSPPPHQGVTVFDLALVKRLILGYDDGLSPFAILAADANRSGTVTGADMLEIRQVILGQKANFPDDIHWRYIEDSYQFPDPQNPFQEPLPESASFYVGLTPLHQARFKAVKIGDLDCDGASFGFSEGESRDRGLPARALSLPDLIVGAGETAEIALQLSEAGQWSAMQWELLYDPEQLEITDFLTEMPNLQLHEADMGFASAPGSLRFLWAGAEGLPLPAGEALFSIRIRALQSLQTSEAFSLGDGMEHLGIRDGEQAAVSLEFRSVEKPKSAGAIYPPQPNPTTGAARLPLQLEQPSTIQVELTDATGRSAWAQRLSLGSGNQWLQIPAEAMPQPGVYFWRAIVGGQSAQGKLLRR